MSAGLRLQLGGRMNGRSPGARFVEWALASGDERVQVGKIRIGSRGSPLALAQAHQVRRRLMEAHGLD